MLMMVPLQASNALLLLPLLLLQQLLLLLLLLLREKGVEAVGTLVLELKLVYSSSDGVLVTVLMTGISGEEEEEQERRAGESLRTG